MIIVRAMMVVLVNIRVLVIPLLAVEHQKIQTKRVKRSDEHSGQYRKISKPGTCQMAFMHSFNNAVF